MAFTLNPTLKGPFQLIDIANDDDRFHLLEDASISRPNLNIDIHPILQRRNWRRITDIEYLNLQPTLRLASMFLKYDSVIEWFLPILFGRTLTDTKTKRDYYSNHWSRSSYTERRRLLAEVRSALNCLAHSLHFCFVVPCTKGKFYARSIMERIQPPHTSSCTEVFIRENLGMRVEVREDFRRFLANEYTSTSLGTKLRHDFTLAVTLLHEITHCLGVMRRGSLDEPHIRLDEPPSPELGAAFENFMFGGIINPSYKPFSETSVLMRKVWVDKKWEEGTGKVWSAVPVAYIAQWFQEDTWKIIESRGPLGIPPPFVRLKVRWFASKYSLITDSELVRRKLMVIKKALWERYMEKHSGKPLPAGVKVICCAHTELVNTESLQRIDTRHPSRGVTTFSNSIPSWRPNVFPEVDPGRSNAKPMLADEEIRVSSAGLGETLQPYSITAWTSVRECRKRRTKANESSSASETEDGIPETGKARMMRHDSVTGRPRVRSRDRSLEPPRERIKT